MEKFIFCYFTTIMSLKIIGDNSNCYFFISPFYTSSANPKNQFRDHYLARFCMNDASVVDKQLN